MTSTNSISFDKYSKEEWFLTIKKQVLGLEILGKKTYIGVSGGPDSVLLGLLIASFINNITILYFDHGARDISDDIGIIQRYFTKKGIEIILGKSEFPGKSETSFRNQRYQFFEHHVGDGLLFLGHHLSDRIETTLINTKRGCGIVGLNSITPISKRKNYTIIRPLLSLQKDTILSLCQELGISYSVDKTNFDTFYTERNTIRNLIIPKYLKENAISITEFHNCWRKIYTKLSSLINNRKEKIGLHCFGNEFFCLGTYYYFTIETNIDIQILLKEFGITGLSKHQINELYNLFTNNKNGHTYCRGWNFFQSFGKSYALLGNNGFRKETQGKVTKKLINDLGLSLEKKWKTYSLGDKNGSKKIKKKFIAYKIPIFIRKKIPLEVFQGKILIPKIFLKNDGNFW